VASETTGQWLWYVFGAQDIIKTADLESHVDVSDVIQLLDWVYYHDVLARFSILYWRYGIADDIYAQSIGTKGWHRVPWIKKSRVSLFALVVDIC
jgi:hypothetical protein